ncbi:MAG: DUF3307 domain-containing protein [Leeuwenhoekiella sp.]|uniref:Uncharacterized conserved membrane protein n=1 Tax=Idiomarina loihiensis (strain ATCC BAA-735 / DSM 15497 / L2-TR) TaxID=283942 RepID=Q5QWV8_IDILO|nr:MULTISPECIES: DUF3307 domain-containing protein [Idiomarina]AAV81413.1 Uncharacterized conserved membrane protein [Idiomarina loihiensis L2TR]AGM35440.1 hypothetical protein K734_02865 [Idiomarina loihiensis GSL 199]PHR95123.1 MAG: DUF3307 domain-containing protein [Leeuwenhoekiella sp.]
MNDYLILMLLLLAHIAGDFYCQPDYLVGKKLSSSFRKRLYANAIHAFIHAGLVVLLLLIPKMSWDDLLVTTAVIGVTHFIIDSLKSVAVIKWVDTWEENEQPEEGSKPRKRNRAFYWFVLDQLAHLSVIILIWLGLFQPFSSIVEYLSVEYLVVVISYLLVLKPTSVLVSLILKLCETREKKDRTLDEAGAVIGYIERLVILTLILVGQYTAIGFVIAAKSVLRFGENKGKDTKLNEYVLLGTLASFAIVLFVGIATTEVLEILKCN